MTAPSKLDEARLRELAEALTFFGRYADETREATATRRNNNANDASKAILALLDALSAERSRHMEYRTTADLLIASLKADLRAERERGDRAVRALEGVRDWIRYELPMPTANATTMLGTVNAALATQKAEGA